MWRATVKGVLARKVRLALTALAVVLGVTFVSGTYVLTDTLKQSFGTPLLAVRGRRGPGRAAATRRSATATAPGQRLPEGVVDAVRQVPGVAAADGFLQGYAQFVEKDGKTTIQTAGAPTFGISWSGGDQVGPARIAEGRRPVARRPGRDGRGHRAAQRLQGRRPGQGPARRRGRGVQDRRAVQARHPGRLRRGELRRVRSAAPRSGCSARRGCSTRSTCGSQPGTSIADGEARRSSRRSTRRSSSRGSSRSRRPRSSPTRPASRSTSSCSVLNDALLGFAGRRAARRRVHHLQHVHDPRLATAARARAAAGDGRERPAGDRLGAGRGRGDRACSRRRSGWCSASRSRRCCSGALPGFGFPVPQGSLVVHRPHGLRVGGRRRSA